MKNGIIWYMIGLILLCTSVKGHAQGIVFFEGTFEDALVKAKESNKLVFVDFYAVWCGPCKQMAEKVFPDEEVGKYMNEKFVCLQVDVEKEGWQKDVAEKYNVSLLPTLIFFKTDGTVIQRLAGAREKGDLLNAGKVVCGEELSFEKLYNRCKSKKDIADMQLLLQRAPDYVGGLEGMEAQKWIVRVDKLYADYVKAKMGPDFINKTDFQIVNRFNKKNVKDDVVMEFIAKNLSSYLNNLGEIPGVLLVEYNNNIIGELAKAGKSDYKKYLDRIKGDLKMAYDIMPTGSSKLTPYEKFKYYYDGMYLLSYKKDVPSYIKLMRKYIETMGDQMGANDYGEMAQNMYQMTKGRLNDEQLMQAKEWLVKAMQYETETLLERINFLTMLGDTYKALKQFKEAKEAYNQAYVESLKLEDKHQGMMVQMLVKRKLQALGLAE